jgi:hypothetical protein
VTAAVTVLDSARFDHAIRPVARRRDVCERSNGESSEIEKLLRCQFACVYGRASASLDRASLDRASFDRASLSLDRASRDRTTSRV